MLLGTRRTMKSEITDTQKIKLLQMGKKIKIRAIRIGYLEKMITRTQKHKRSQKQNAQLELSVAALYGIP